MIHIVASETVIARLESLAEQVRLGGEPTTDDASPLAIPILMSYESDGSEGGHWAWKLWLELPGQDIERSASTLAQLLDGIPESGEAEGPIFRYRRIAQRLERLAAILQAEPPATGWSSPIYGTVELSYMFGERQDGSSEGASKDWHWDLEVVNPGQGAFIGTDKDLETLFEMALLRYGISDPSSIPNER